MYIITYGFVDITRFENGEERHIVRCPSWTTVGERSILFGGVTNSNCIAVGNVSCLYLMRKHFELCFTSKASTLHRLRELVKEEHENEKKSEPEKAKKRGRRATVTLQLDIMGHIPLLKELGIKCTPNPDSAVPPPPSHPLMPLFYPRANRLYWVTVPCKVSVFIEASSPVALQ